MIRLCVFIVLLQWLGLPAAVGRVRLGEAFVKNSQTIVFASLPDQRYGQQPFDLEATASSGLPVSYSILSGPATVAGNSLTLTGAGTVTVRASQAGNDDYYPAPPVTHSFNVNKANQSIDFADLDERTLLESPFRLTATATSGLPVQLTVAAGPATISADYVNLTGTGLVTIRAYQAGNDRYNSAPYVSQSFLVSKADQRISFNDLSDRIQGGDDFALTASASSGLPVSYEVYYGPAMLTGSTVRLTGFGKVRVRAAQAGNFYYHAVAIDTFLCVVPVKPYITLAGSVLLSSSLTNNQWFYEGEPIPGATTLALSVTQNGRYSVQVANPDEDCGSSALADPVTVYLTGVEGIEAESRTAWEVYPNPSTDWVTVRVPTDLMVRQVHLYAATGALVWSNRFSVGTEECRIPVADLGAGLYLLEIRTENGIVRRRKVRVAR